MFPKCSHFGKGIQQAFFDRQTRCESQGRPWRKLARTNPLLQIRLPGCFSERGLGLAQALSGRLAAIVDALPLRSGLRVLEIGCGPGAAAREIAQRIGEGHVLAIDRSAKAIAQAKAASRAEIKSGRLSLRQVAAEDFELEAGEAPYDIALAVRVGALDGRHPEAYLRAKRRIAAALIAKGRLFIDGGDPLRELSLLD
jgi:SAM-dependent methyltransferase